MQELGEARVAARSIGDSVGRCRGRWLADCEVERRDTKANHADSLKDRVTVGMEGAEGSRTLQTSSGVKLKG